MNIDDVRAELQRAYDGDAWHGAPLRTLLAGLSQAQVTSRPIAGVHTIAELVAHLTTWTDIVRRRVMGEEVEAATEQDWPATEGVAWADLLEGLDRAHHGLLQTLDQCQPDVLEAQTPGRDYTNQVMLVGLVQHHAYHGGQIGLLRKLVALV